MKRLLVVFLALMLLAGIGCKPPSPTPVFPPTVTETVTNTIKETVTVYITPSPVSERHTPAAGILSVYFIDVGQGDAILIDQGETEVLIDGGDGRINICSFLEQYVDDPLEAVIATHPHADHIGGLPAVFTKFSVLDVWTNGETATTATYKTFSAAVSGSGAKTHIVQRGDGIYVDRLSFSVLNPPGLYSTTNNNSLVLSLVYGDTTFLFAGDAEQPAETDMLEAGIVPRANVLKVGHHGSRTSSSALFLASVKPEIAVYSAGEDNTYGHPHAETITALESAKSHIYGTDVNGNIKIEARGRFLTSWVSVAIQPTVTVTITAPASQPTPPVSTTTVYITNTGEKYHRYGCRYLSKSCIPISRSSAISRGYTPCSVCNPP